MIATPTYQAIVRAWIAAIVLGVCMTAMRVDAYDARGEISRSSPATTLVTRLGDRIVGRWLASENPATIDWQAEGFVEPFQFDQQSLSTIQVHHSTAAPPITGTYRCELSNGDILQGSPAAISDEQLLLDVAHTGRVRVERHRLRKLVPQHSAVATVDMTPYSINDWQGDRSKWQEAAGRITAKGDNAKLLSSLHLGDKSHLSLSIAWERRPDFRIDFGATADFASGLRLETWQDQLVFVAESPSAADIRLVKKLGHGSDTLSLNIFVDTSRQAILVTSEDGRKMGQIRWEGEYQDTFRLLARKKGLHFQSASVQPWDGSSPQPHDAGKPSVHFKDGKTLRAAVTSWDAESQEWTIVTSDAASATQPNDLRVSSAKIDSLAFGGSVDNDLASVQVVSRNGMRLSGELFKLSDDAVWISCLGIKDPIAMPLSNLRGMVFLKPHNSEIAKTTNSVRLHMDEATIVGRLVDGPANGQAGALVWKPDAGRNASSISSDASGVIIYRAAPRSIVKQKSNVRAQNNGAIAGIVRLFSRSTSTKSNKSSKPGKSHQGSTLYLRSGDSIPCQPKRIDREGVTFSSPTTNATFAAHDQIKALVLVDRYKPARVTKQQRDRLLTLPRIQQEYPPKHLLLSVDGDLLRTRLISMDDKSITTEVRLNPTSLPRDRVAAIAWLHPDELDENEEEQTPTDKQDPRLRVLAVQTDGIRLTLHPQRFAAGILFGDNSVFGKCRVDVSQVEKLLFGKSIEEENKKQSHQLMTLKPAIVPRFVTMDPSTPTGAGQNSALVGKAAPSVKLKKLDGSKFDLADHKGKVIVLDFWATWCGPCIQWMPQLEQIVSGYSERDVELFTINLLQDNEAIEPALERMQINPVVLLDIDGVVADAYQANAIPQTVIIDQQGKVARLFIGGSPQLKQPLIEALDALTK